MGLKEAFKNILGIGQEDKVAVKEAEQKLDSLCEEIFGRENVSYYYAIDFYSVTAYEEAKNAAADVKIQMIKQAIKFIIDYNKRSTYNTNDHDYLRNHIYNNLITGLFRSSLGFDDAHYSKLIHLLTDNTDKYQGVMRWSAGLLAKQLETHIKKNGLSDDVKSALKRMMKEGAAPAGYYKDKDWKKLKTRLEEIIFKAENGEANDAVQAIVLDEADEVGKTINRDINGFDKAEKNKWYRVLQLCRKATSSKPTNKFIKEAEALINDIGEARFMDVVSAWFELFSTLPFKATENTYTYPSGENTTYTNYFFMADTNLQFIKGLAWMFAAVEDKNVTPFIAALAEKSFRKIPGVGPAAAAVGNACIYVLANTKGMEGIGHLSRLRLKIKQNSTQNLIEKYITEAATAHNVSPHEIEDMVVDAHGLEEGKIVFDDFEEGFKAEITLTPTGKTELKWYKKDGSEQKSVPAVAKEKYPQLLKEIKSAAAEIQKSLAAQKTRIDQFYKYNRSWSFKQFEDHYFNHGLMCNLSRRLIWTFENSEGSKTNAFYHENKWVDAKGNELQLNFDDNTKVSLWHPALSNIEEVKSWRGFISDNKIVQPLKQAYREVYLLTPAEINTRTYSNRMAAHILKQHQFANLAKLRGWKYTLMGGWDHGIANPAAEIMLPEYKLKVEFWINELNNDDSINESGIWLYVATDQVRFSPLNAGIGGNNDGVELTEIPPVLLSEILRDLDLFVGVASVGNDPMWSDKGNSPRFADYWQSYSFGDLSEIAKSRKEILTNLLPRLKIAKVAEIKDKFLVVKGKLRTYKIHIGSTNILMEPNDQYLCIVPQRSSQENTASQVFLPFEGDSGLSVIISKALLLAEDDKITDKSITMQIKGK